MSSWRNPSETKRRRNITLASKDLQLIDANIPRGGFSKWIRQKLREDFTLEEMGGKDEEG